MEKVPIKFTHQGKEYDGYLQAVFGGGQTNIFHLMIDNYYFGRLHYSNFSNGWVFDPTPKTEGFKELADYFGECVKKPL